MQSHYPILNTSDWLDKKKYKQTQDNLNYCIYNWNKKDNHLNTCRNLKVVGESILKVSLDCVLCISYSMCV